MSQAQVAFSSERPLLQRAWVFSRDAFTHGPPNILKFRGLRAKFREASEFQVPLQTYLATMSIKSHANRVLGTIHVTQNFLGVFKGAQMKSGPKAPTDLNAALVFSHYSTSHFHIPSHFLVLSNLVILSTFLSQLKRYKFLKRST